MTIVIIFFFFTDTPTTDIYTLSLHDALPISTTLVAAFRATLEEVVEADLILHVRDISHPETQAQLLDRSEEHTSELQSPDHLVCRLLLEKKKIQLTVSPTEATPRIIIRSTSR